MAAPRRLAPGNAAPPYGENCVVSSAPLSPSFCRVLDVCVARQELGSVCHGAVVMILSCV